MTQEQGSAVEVIYSADDIAARLEVLARDITARKLERPLVVAVLKGSFVFTADLIRALSRHGVDWPMDFITLSSYGEATASSGTVRLTRDINEDVSGRVVLLIDDILESGRTLGFARDLFLQRGAAKVWLCTLLDKPTRRAAAIEADFAGFRIGDEFQFYQIGASRDDDAPIASPGIALNLLAMRHLHERGVRWYDFLKGSQGYKRHYSTGALPLWHREEVRSPVLRAALWLRARRRGR